MLDICDIVKKYKELPIEMIIIENKDYSYIENLISNVGKYPQLYSTIKEYYKTNPKEINNIGAEAQTPLFFAICSCRLIKFLLKNGANVNHKNIYGCVVLYYAMKYCNLESIKVLCDYGARMSLISKFRLMLIVCSIDTNMAQLLLEYDNDFKSLQFIATGHKIKTLNVKN